MRRYTWMICILFTCFHMQATAQVTIAGNYPGFKGDSLELRYWSRLPNSMAVETAYRRQVVVIDEREQFHFQFNTKELVYIEINHFLRKGIINHVLLNFIAVDGDDITLHVSNDTAAIQYRGNFAQHPQDILFSGKGSTRYRCMYRLQKQERLPMEAKPAIPEVYTRNRNMKKISWMFERTLMKEKEQLAMLHNYKDSISPETYELLALNIHAARMEMVYRYINQMEKALEQDNEADRQMFAAYYQRHLQAIGPPVSDTLQAASLLYPLAILKKLTFESSYFGRAAPPEIILVQYTGILRERLLTEYLVEYYTRLPASIDPSSYLSYLKDPLYHDLLQRTVDAQSEGSTLDDLALPDMDGDTIRLFDFRGKVVFIDFWFTGCAGCQAYYKNVLSVVEEKFSGNKDIVFISVSIDADRDHWLKSIATGNYTSTKVVNLYTAGEGSHHAIIRQLGVKSYPRPLIIGRDGRIFSKNMDELRFSSETLSSTIRKALDDK